MVGNIGNIIPTTPKHRKIVPAIKNKILFILLSEIRDSSESFSIFFSTLFSVIITNNILLNKIRQSKDLNLCHFLYLIL